MYRTHNHAALDAIEEQITVLNQLYLGFIGASKLYKDALDKEAVRELNESLHTTTQLYNNLINQSQKKLGLPITL